MKVDLKQGKRVPNTFDADLSYANNSSYNEDSTVRKAQSTVRSQFSKGASPEKDYHFRNLIDSEVIESVLEPINGIEDLIKDTPEQLFIKHQLTTYKTQQNHRNRAKLREMMANTKPAQFEEADKNAGDKEKEFFDELQSFGSKIMNLNDEILEQVKHSRIQGLDTNESFQRYPGGNEATILDLKS